MENKLQKAIKIATKYHEWQIRKNNTPYISHPIAVMELLKNRNFPEDALIAAVLHDVCEDTKLNNINLNKLFWNRVWFIVNALTKNKKPKNNKLLKEEYIKKQNFRKISNLENHTNFDEYFDYRFHIYLNRLYTWIIAEPWIFFIKISDQINNLWDMETFPYNKQKRKISEIENFFLPIYKKSKNIFNIDKKTINEYNLFIDLLTNTLNKAKNNLYK